WSTPPATTSLYPLSLHDALPIFARHHRVREHVGGAPEPAAVRGRRARKARRGIERLEVVHLEDDALDLLGLQVMPGGHLAGQPRSEEHTSELQSRVDLVCRLLLE